MATKEGWGRPLTPFACPAHTARVAAKSATGCGNPKSTRRTSATRQALFVCLSFLYGGRCGAAERLAGVLVGRFSTPASFAARAVESAATNSNFLQGVRCYV